MACMDPKRKLKPTIQQLVGPRMKLPLSSHTHLHQPPATEGASLERKGKRAGWHHVGQTVPWPMISCSGGCSTKERTKICHTPRTDNFSGTCSCRIQKGLALYPHRPAGFGLFYTNCLSFFWSLEETEKRVASYLCKKERRLDQSIVFCSLQIGWWLGAILTVFECNNQNTDFFVQLPTNQMQLVIFLRVKEVQVPNYHNENNLLGTSDL